MPKSPKVGRKGRPHQNSLAQDYSPYQPLKQKAPKKRKNRDDENEQIDTVIDSRASRRILNLGQDLADEDKAEHQARYVSGINEAFANDPRLGLDEYEGDGSEDGEDAEAWEDDDDEMRETEEIDPSDLDTFNRFNPPDFDDPLLNPSVDKNTEGTRNLADIILAKIAEHEAAAARKNVAFDELAPDQDFDQPAELPPKVVEVYTKIGHLLSRYRSGPLPKPFKIIPTLPLPMQAAIVPVTRPDTWTPHAVFAASRIFISSGGPIAQHFLSEVLLDRVRDDIRDSVGQHRRLNVHLYAALRKSLYRPAAFFKGVLFPLLSSGSATLREAGIVASVIAKAHVPVLHSAAAISRCCDIATEQMLTSSGRAADLEAAGATNLVIKVLLEKKYALPYQTIDALVFHFLRFRPTLESEYGETSSGNGKLPVIWHQCLLVFAQRYRDEIAEEQREALLDLLLVRGHHAIGPEIRRELLAGRGRGVVAESDGILSVNGRKSMVIDGDDTLMG